MTRSVVITPVLALLLSQAPAPALLAQTTTTPRRAAATAALPADRAAIDSLFRGAVAPAGPGVAVIAVRQGRTVFRGGYGMANLELGVPATPEHVFRIGSVTKQFTSAAILMLVEERKLALSDPITAFLPDYPTQGRTITVEHLLTHTSGIRSYTDMPAWRGMMRQDLPLTELIGLFKNEPMGFAPGEKWRYNNSGYILLGAIIEKVSGRPYTDFVRERIFEPLGLTDTRYDVTESIVPRRAAGYVRSRTGLANAQYLSMTQPYAAGALVSTVDDLAKWDAGLSAGKVVTAASLEKAFTSFALADGSLCGYGYGWQIGNEGGRPVQEHGGGIPGFRAHVVRLPADGVYVAVLSNVSAAEPDPQSLARKAAVIAAGRPLADPKAATLTTEQLEACVGRFVAVDGTRYLVTREGDRMFVQAGSGGRTEIIPASIDAFFVKDAFMRLRFDRDGTGTVVRLVVNDWGDRPAAIRDETPDAPAPVAVAVDPAIYDSYVGEYELTPGFVIAVTRDGGRLITQATGQAAFEVFPSAPTEFFLKVVNARISFVKDGTGAVTGLVLHQGGRDMPAKKIK